MASVTAPRSATSTLAPGWTLEQLTKEEFRNLAGPTMRVALGIKAHSGWVAMVVLGKGNGELQVVDRRRMYPVEGQEASWAK